MGNIKFKKIRPVFNSILVTAVKEEIPELTMGRIITQEALQLGYLPVQTVVSVGNVVTCAKAGDKVYIDFSKYAVVKQKADTLSVKEDMDEHYSRQIVGYRIEPIIIDGVEHLLLFDRDIQFVIEEFEEIKQSSVIMPTLFIP